MKNGKKEPNQGKGRGGVVAVKGNMSVCGEESMICTVF